VSTGPYTLNRCALNSPASIDSTVGATQNRTGPVAASLTIRLLKTSSACGLTAYSHICYAPNEICFLLSVTLVGGIIGKKKAELSSFEASKYCFWS
jgi:hypothetical protein